MELTSPDINSGHMRRSGPQKNICKAPSGRPDIKAGPLSRIDTEDTQPMGKLQPTTRDIWMRGNRNDLRFNG